MPTNEHPPKATLDVLTTTQVGAILGVSARTVLRMVTAGRLSPVAKLAGPNGAHLFSPDDVAAYRAAVRSARSDAYRATRATTEQETR